MGIYLDDFDTNYNITGSVSHSLYLRCESREALGHDSLDDVVCAFPE